MYLASMPTTIVWVPRRLVSKPSAIANCSNDRSFAAASTSYDCWLEHMLERMVGKYLPQRCNSHGCTHQDSCETPMTSIQDHSQQSSTPSQNDGGQNESPLFCIGLCMQLILPHQRVGGYSEDEMSESSDLELD